MQTPLPWQDEYSLRDHLGNTRVTFSDLNYDGYIQVTGTDWSGTPIPADYSEVMQENHYYPFGMNMEGQWYPPQKPEWENKYQYNGKELNEELGLGWNDYGARWYDACVGRFTGVDLMTDKYPSFSNYSYVENNPILFIDPDGNELIVRFIGTGSNTKFIKSIEKMFNGQFQLTFKAVRDKDGNTIDGMYKVGIVKTKGGGDLNKLSEGAQNFYSALEGVINSKTVTVDVSIVVDDPGIKVGDYDNSKIDIGDVEAFPEFNHSRTGQDGPTQAGKLIHEIREQFVKASKKIPKGSRKGYDTAHENAIGWENSVNGNNRIGDQYMRKGAVERFKLRNVGVTAYSVYHNKNGKLIVVKNK